MLSLPRGTRDYALDEAMLLNNLASKAEAVFRRFGFSPLITPVIETNEVLGAKTYGDELSKEVFGIANEDSSLRYDFTVPLSRYMAQNKDLSLPFKRYQIGPIWRKDEPQFMRLREFWQADVDIVGSSEVGSDAEALAATAIALNEMGLSQYTIKLNSRVLLNSILDMFKIEKSKSLQVLRLIDKLYKLGADQTIASLEQLGIDSKTAESVISFVSSGDLESKKKALAASSPVAKAELEKVDVLMKLVKSYGPECGMELDLSLVRGFDYYTGFIWEFVVEKEGKRLPSLGGGGRYDNLIGLLSGKGKSLPATGSSIGISRAFDLLYEKTGVKTYSKAFIAYVSDSQFGYALDFANKLREEGINTDLNVSKRSLSKQLEYAASLGIPFVVIIGDEELKQGKVRVRDMSTGSEELLDQESAIEKLKV